MGRRDGAKGGGMKDGMREDGGGGEGLGWDGTGGGRRKMAEDLRSSASNRNAIRIK